MQGTGSERTDSIAHLVVATLLRDYAYCSQRGWHRLKTENLVKNHCSCAADCDADFISLTV